jgi:hypothetical protein
MQSTGRVAATSEERRLPVWRSSPLAAWLAVTAGAFICHIGALAYRDLSREYADWKEYKRIRDTAQITKVDTDLLTTTEADALAVAATAITTNEKMVNSPSVHYYIVSVPK